MFTQDQNLAGQGKWLFTKYDHFGRALYTGLFASTDSREALQTTLESHSPIYESKTDTPTIIDGTEVYYTNAAFPDTGQQLLTISYYDTYNFDLDGAVAEDSYGVAASGMTKTLSTGNKTRVLGTDHWITTVTYYDKKARPIYTYTKNPYLNTTDKIKNKVDFVGKVLETTSVHTKDGEKNITSIDKFSYDRMGRLLKQTHQIAGQPEETLAEHVYDELGQLIQKKVGNTTVSPLQTVNYSYNIRGWLSGINDVNNIQNDLFSFRINYNDPTAGTPLYNGNISQTHWRTNNTDSSLKHYNYNYDALNRITAAIDNTGNYNLNSIGYDKNGNILSLSRQGHINEDADSFGVMDDLIYSYDSGNKLIKVDENGNALYGFKDKETEVDYSYDLNGNMITDANKEITNISYNHLNMPTAVTFNNNQSRKISYIYTADGIKQQKVVNDNSVVTTTDYAGAYIYENGSLKFMSQVEGYIEPDGAGGYDYVYQYKDMWGNTRITYSDDNGDGLVDISEIKREQNYYPFGLAHRGYNGITSGVKNNLKTYQGQEFTDDLDLNTHEWKYRMSDPSTGRFWQVDPLAEDYTYNSTYAFQENKMGMGVELEGLEMSPFHKARKSITENHSTAGQVAIGFLIGGANAVNNTAQGIADAVSDPVGTAQAIGSAIANPFETGAAIGSAVEAKVDQAVNGDALDKGIVAGEATMAIADVVVGTKGTTAATKAVTTSVKTTKVAIETVTKAKSVGPITGHTKHGLNQSISRNNGKGVSAKAKLDAVKSPKTVTQQSEGRTKYKGNNATVILNKDGKVITTYGKPRNNN